MGYAWMLAAALAAVLGSCLFNALVRLVWRPRAIAKRLRRQGVRGMEYKFFVGNLDDIKRLRAGVVLDVASHDFLPIAQPQFRKWIPLYGCVFLYWFGSTPNICVAFSTLFNVQIPGFRYLPTKKNLKAWRLDKKVRSTLMQIIKNRLSTKDKAGYGNDLLGLMLEACAPEHGSKNQLLSVDEIIDECKTFFAGARDHLAPAQLDHVPSEHAPRVAGEAQGGGAEKVGKGSGSHSRHAQQAEACKHVPFGDAEAVQPRPADPEEDEISSRARRHHGARRHDPDDTDRDDTPRQGGLGRGRRRVRPAEVRQWRRRHQDLEAPQRVAVLLHGPEGVHRAEPCDDRGEGRGRRDPPEVRIVALPEVRPRADQHDHTAAQVWASDGRQKCPCVTCMLCRSCLSSLGRTPPRPWFRCL